MVIGHLFAGAHIRIAVDLGDWYLDRLIGFVKACITLLALVFNTLVLAPLLIVLAVLKLVSPGVLVKKKLSIIIMLIARLWVRNNTWIIRSLHSIVWDVQYADGLTPNDWSMVIANHQTYVDIPVLQAVFQNKLPFLKFFLKQELIWVPLLGLAWWALDFPFMKRYSHSYLKKNPAKRGKDFEATQKSCEKFKYTPISVFNFLEGTRFTPQKHQKQASPYRYLLKPKAGGIGYVLAAMDGKIKNVVNVTLFYPDGIPGFWDYLSGNIKKIVVRMTRIELPDHLLAGNYQSSTEYRKVFHKWVSELWQEKDAQLAELTQQSQR